jgi:hypothetical protein
MVRDFQSRDRQGGARADAGGRGPPARRRWSPASAAARTPSACSTPSSTTRASRSSASRPRGIGLDDRMQHAPRASTGGRPGVLHGNKTYLLQDEDGQITRGPLDLGRPRLSRHRARAFLAARDRPRRIRLVTDDEALEAFQLCCAGWKASSRRWSPATRWPMSMKIAPTMGKDQDHRHEPVRPRRQGHLQTSRCRDPDLTCFPAPGRFAPRRRAVAAPV